MKKIVKMNNIQILTKKNVKMIPTDVFITEEDVKFNLPVAKNGSAADYVMVIKFNKKIYNI